MNSQLKKGALELCVLAILSVKECYGYELVSILSKGIQITDGTIYPLLKRLKDDGYVETYLKETSGGPPRKYYVITEKGMKEKQALQEEWTDFIKGVNMILEGDSND